MSGRDDGGARYGRGVGFGFGLDGTARVRLAAGTENVVESLQIILATEPGERVMRPTFGTGLRRFLLAPNTPVTHRAIEERITRAIERWERRVTLEDVAVTAVPGVATEAVAVIRYRLVASGQPGELAVGVPVAATGTGAA